MNQAWPHVRITWQPTSSAEFPYEALHEGQHLTLRVNDFPRQALYTLLADGKDVQDLEEWPAAWTRPGL